MSELSTTFLWVFKTNAVRSILIPLTFTKYVNRQKFCPNVSFDRLTKAVNYIKDSRVCMVMGHLKVKVGPERSNISCGDIFFRNQNNNWKVVKMNKKEICITNYFLVNLRYTWVGGPLGVQSMLWWEGQVTRCSEVFKTIWKQRNINKTLVIQVYNLNLF